MARCGLLPVLVLGVLGVQVVGCRPVAGDDVRVPERDACEVVLRRAIDHARGQDGVDTVYVLGTDAACEAAAARMIDEPGIEGWRRARAPRCPGRRCGPADGNPLVVIHRQHEGCFRVSELRWRGGSGVTRCLDDPGAGPLSGDVVLY
ncbi:MAG: hypothetical protein K0V04_31495 [Deltaproteobacteria bacterium]|nr:hypothetical protein [Deltaproteobacteria bacterium]